MSNFTACFRLFHRGRSFRREELSLVESLERQRHRTAGVHAVIDDPQGKFAPVLLAYLAYVQHLTQKEAIIVTPTKKYSPLGVGGLPPTKKYSPLGAGGHPLTLTPRSYLKILGYQRRPIGQILLLNAEKYCPSLPLHRSRLDAILHVALPYLNGPNTVVIIHGSSQTARNTRFRHWLKIAADPQSIYFLHPGPSAEAKPKPLRPKIILHHALYIMHPPSCIMHPKSCINKSLPAFPLRQASTKIPA